MRRSDNFPTDEDILFFLKEMAERNKHINTWEQALGNKSLSNLAQIKREVQNGNEAAFTPFFQKNYYKLYYALIGKVKSKEKTEDIVMETFFKFYDRFLIQNKPIPDNASGYLYRMASNFWKDNLKGEVTGEMDVAKEPIQVDHVTQNEEIENKELMDKALQMAWSELSLRNQNLLTDSKLKKIPTEKLVEKYGFAGKAVLFVVVANAMKKLKKRANEIYNDLNQ